MVSSEANTLALLFVLIKFSICSLNELLECNLSHKDNFGVFEKSSLAMNIRELFLLDLEILNSMYARFMGQYYSAKMSKCKELNEVKQL